MKKTTIFEDFNNVKIIEEFNPDVGFNNLTITKPNGRCTVPMYNEFLEYYGLGDTASVTNTYIKYFAITDNELNYLKRRWTDYIYDQIMSKLITKLHKKIDFVWHYGPAEELFTLKMINEDASLSKINVNKLNYLFSISDDKQILELRGNRQHIAEDLEVLLFLLS